MYSSNLHPCTRVFVSSERQAHSPLSPQATERSVEAEISEAGAKSLGVVAIAAMWLVAGQGGHDCCVCHGV